MKVTLEFDLPDEDYAFENAKNAHTMVRLLGELSHLAYVGMNDIKISQEAREVYTCFYNKLFTKYTPDNSSSEL